MKCPVCGNEMKKGLIEASDTASIFNMNAMLTWCPEEEVGKWRRKNTVILRLKGEGYYCSECMQVHAVFDEK